MCRTRHRFSLANKLLLAAALFLYPCVVLAQHGGHGGGSMGGGGMNGGGRPTGVDTKDDLKDFHQALAVQATSQQMIEYASMLKSTTAACAELSSFQGQLGKENSAAEIARHSASLEQSLDQARSDNKKFLEGLSRPQKTGLKDITKKLTKADSELAQKGRELGQKAGDSTAAGQGIAASAQNLEHALANFQSQQLDLGQEMSIVDPDDSQALTFHIPPVKNSVNFENQPVAIITSGVISKLSAKNDQSSFTLQLTADLSDLQQNITEVLRAQLDKTDRCGERIAIRNATLIPIAPASLVTVQLHFERWACLGKETINEMAEGDGMIEIKLTPAVAEDGRLRLVPETRRIDAQGLVGELLRSGSMGEAVRNKIADAILSTMRQGGDFRVMLPPSAQGYATLHRAQFQSTGAGELIVILDGEIRVANEKVTSLTTELKERSTAQEAMPR